MSKKVKNLCLIGVFSALCFVSLLVTISIPSVVGPQMIHFGNAITIIVAILFGPIIGGLSGAIGMTIYDCMNPVYITSAPKTFILKLGIGLIAGFIFLLLKKKEIKKLKYIILGFGILFLSFGSFALITSITSDGFIIANPTKLEIINNTADLSSLKEGKYYFEIDEKKYILNIDEEITISYGNKLETEGLIIKNINSASYCKKAFSFHWASYTFPLILGVLLIIAFFFINKLFYLHQSAIVSAIMAVIFNIIGEFVGKFIMQMIIGQGFMASIVNAYVSLPATIINACLCVIIVAILYPSLSKAISLDKNE